MATNKTRAELVAEYKLLSRELADEFQQEWMANGLRLKRDKVQDEIDAIDEISRDEEARDQSIRLAEISR